MDGAVVVTVLLSYRDADEIERLTELRMLQEPHRWSTRTEALIEEIGLDARTYLIPKGTKVAALEAENSEAVPHALPAAVVGAEVLLGGRLTARRRMLHEAYLDLLQEELSPEDQEELSPEDPDDVCDSDD